jgi:predicted TPR repeat methyltransferase
VTSETASSPNPEANDRHASSRLVRTAPLRLLPRDALVKTSRIDHSDWNFRPLLGAIQRLHFRFARELLGRERVGRLLEIGYGSGIFLPQLNLHCTDFHGVDLHGKHFEVARELSRVGVHPRLCHARATRLPYPDRYFDRVVAVRSLTFIDGLGGALAPVVIGGTSSGASIMDHLSPATRGSGA